MHPSRMAYVEEAEPEDTGIDLANVPLDNDYDIPSAGPGLAPERASAFQSQMDRRKKAAAIAVPTDDKRVRERLRLLGEPVTEFGEGPGDRRDRLRGLLAQEGTEQDGEGDSRMVDAGEGEDDAPDEEFYTKGAPELVEARKMIARYSLPRAKSRIASQKSESTIPLRIHVKFRKEIKAKLEGFELQGSQTAGDRPVSMTRFAPNGEIIAAGNWGGSIKLLNVPDLKEIKTLRGHTDRIGGISWFPDATMPGSTVSENSVNLASGGGDGKVHLWSMTQDTPISTLEGHNQRVCRVEFHPSGKYLASASEDTTWRLWDVETTTEILLQEGHSRGVFALAFNTDGSLLASAGTDSIGRIWDLRTGRTVMILEGHIKPIYALDWGVDGHRVLSGSEDGWIKCWDVRKVQPSGGIGAHRMVSDLRWYKGMDDPARGFVPETDDQGARRPKKSGTFFVSSGFDKTVKIFSADDWSQVQILTGHTGNVHSVDVTKDAKWIVSGGYDRTVKLWGRNDGEGM
ncbi:unnamed protein product [Diplocarpon coronariae]|uniref:Pre-mRNA processing factor 4 (PRP4)-like domain-containing protein n=1 Tax=Diplocarpon coronariae TaxID=2795749 RepID=A0A218YUB4_9HELO|nr:hypothetical protein B2J93_2900 [Marssonina coronariae]